jgi:response regulator RpfG family c-di-GMP phosphodiesterase
MNEEERIGQLLVREGVITEEDLKHALEAQKEAYGKPLGEVLINLKLIDESDFLRILAKKFHTQYLTTKKLSDVKVSDAILKLVPAATAEKYNLFPVQFKKSDKTLTVAMTNPDDVAAVDEIKFVSGVPNVKSLVALKDAIKAAVAKWYKGEKNAFGVLLGAEEELSGYELGSSSAPAASLEQEDGPLDIAALVASSDGDEALKIEIEEPAEEVILGKSEKALYLGGMDQMPGDNNLSRDDGIVIEDLGGAGGTEVEEVMVSPLIRPPQPEPAEEAEAKPVRRTDVKKYRLRMLVVESNEAIRRFIVKLFGHEGFKVKGLDTKDEALAELKQGEYDSLVIKERDLGEGEEFVNLMAERFPQVELCSIKDYASAVIGETRAHKRLMASFLETLDIVIGLLEMESGGMQGHSHNVSKYARLIASKLDLPQKEVDIISLAAFVHDLGKKGMRHWTVLETGTDTDAAQLMEEAEIPLRLLSAAKYPAEIANIIRHQYEKWDGTGIPDKQQAENIPVGARVLALVEAFEHLTNKYAGKEALEPTAAVELLKKSAGKLFDPSLVDLLISVVRDDLYLQQMAGVQDRVLVVDTEVDFITLLELRLINMGLAVSIAKKAEDALEKAKTDQPSLIITEVDLPGTSGYDMIEKLKSRPETRDIPFIFVSRKDDSASVTKGFRLGAEDYMVKPVKVDVMAAKINTMISRLRGEKKAAPAAAGVSGSLSEMGIPDIIQILGAGRKTGRITLENNGATACIDMDEGQVVNALIEDMKGEEAFYKILYWTQGTFSIDPTAKPEERLITASIDSLMLEGFRRMDEASHGAAPEDISLDGSDFF